MFLKSTYSFFFSFLSFFLLWSGSGTSREVVSAFNSRVDITSLLVIVSTFFLVTPFVLTDLVHRKPEYLSLSTGSKFATSKSFQFWRDCFPLDTLLFIIFLFFWFLTGCMRGALCMATRLYILYVAADESTSGWEFYCYFLNPHTYTLLFHLNAYKNICLARTFLRFLLSLSLELSPF